MKKMTWNDILILTQWALYCLICACVFLTIAFLGFMAVLRYVSVDAGHAATVGRFMEDIRSEKVEYVGYFDKMGNKLLELSGNGERVSTPRLYSRLAWIVAGGELTTVHNHPTARQGAARAAFSTNDLLSAATIDEARTVVVEARRTYALEASEGWPEPEEIVEFMNEACGLGWDNERQEHVVVNDSQKAYALVPDREAILVALEDELILPSREVSGTVVSTGLVSTGKLIRRFAEEFELEYEEWEVE